jgi:hypothetical protein
VAEEISKIKAIKDYFEEGVHGRKVEMAELKALSMDERSELGKLAVEELKA